MLDGDLVQQTLLGRREAYEELVHRWAPRVTAVCCAKVGYGPTAEDLAQEALLRGFRALPTLAEPAKFGSWLCGIAVRTCLDWLKAKERTQVSFGELHPDRSEDATFEGRSWDGPAAVEHADELDRLLAEVEALPDRQREALTLFYYERLSYEEMAAMLGVSSATINARLTQARNTLRERLLARRR